VEQNNALWITGAGSAIRQLRGERPIGTVAEAMRIDTSTLSRIERNERRLSVEEVANFANVIGMSPRRVLKECFQAALPGFAKNPGGKLVAQILDAIAEEDEVEKK